MPSDQARDHGLADPAESQADHGDAQLNAVHDLVEMLVKALDDARANPSRGDELLDASIAHAHQGEFGGGEERIGRHQKQDQKDPEQHKGDHGRVILTFERRLEGAGGASGTTVGIGLRPWTSDLSRCKSAPCDADLGIAAMLRLSSEVRGLRSI